VTDFILTIGLKDWAQFDQNGNAESSPKYPFALVFTPNANLTNSFSDIYDDNMDYLKQIGSIGVNSVVYDVYAQELPTSKDLTLIGSLVAQTGFTTSAWGDTGMFFTHNYIEKDLADHPDWTEYIYKFSLFSSTKQPKCAKPRGCPFLQ